MKHQLLYLTGVIRHTASALLYDRLANSLAATMPTNNKTEPRITPRFARTTSDVDRFRLIVPQPWELARKVELSLIGSRQCAFHRAIDEPCALPLSPPNGGSKQEFLHLALPFISSLQVIVDTSNLVCGLNIASPSPRMTNRPWNGRGHVTWPILNFLVPLRYLLNGLSSRLQIWCACWSQQVPATDDKMSLKVAWSLSRDLFNFRKISDNISKTIQDSVIVSIKFE